MRPALRVVDDPDPPPAGTARPEPVPGSDPRTEPGPEPEPGRGRVPAPTYLPVPGRHAARRPLDLLGGLLPATLRGRVALGPGQLGVVAVLVAAGLAATCWWVVRGDPEPAIPVTAAAVGPAAGSGEPIAERSRPPAPLPTRLPGPGSLRRSIRRSIRRRGRR